MIHANQHSTRRRSESAVSEWERLRLFLSQAAVTIAIAKMTQANLGNEDEEVNRVS
jgi:hypothetical protein